jgi:BlaI family transcriptional regulator, penicillinase repressor
MSTRPRPRLPGDGLEYAVLSTLWDLGRASVRDIHARVGRPADLVYTTIAKVLDRLYAKQLVSRTRSGRTFIYEPTVAKEVVERRRAERTVRLLGNEPRPALAALVEAVESTDPELLEELARLVAARRRARRGT